MRPAAATVGIQILWSQARFCWVHARQWTLHRLQPFTSYDLFPKASCIVMATLPPAEVFDILTSLYTLLSPLLLLEQGAAEAHPSKKDVASVVANIKAKVQKARASLDNLPGMSRTLNAQAAEIHMLQEMIVKHRQALLDLL